MCGGRVWVEEGGEGGAEEGLIGGLVGCENLSRRMLFFSRLFWGSSARRLNKDRACQACGGGGGGECRTEAYRSLLGRVAHLLDKMRHAVGAVESVHGRVKGHDEDPPRARVARIVDEELEDAVRVVFRCHDAEADRPGDAAADDPKRAQQVQCWKISESKSQSM